MFCAVYVYETGTATNVISHLSEDLWQHYRIFFISKQALISLNQVQVFNARSFLFAYFLRTQRFSFLLSSVYSLPSFPFPFLCAAKKSACLFSFISFSLSFALSTSSLLFNYVYPAVSRWYQLRFVPSFSKFFKSKECLARFPGGKYNMLDFLRGARIPKTTTAKNSLQWCSVKYQDSSVQLSSLASTERMTWSFASSVCSRFVKCRESPWRLVFIPRRLGVSWSTWRFRFEITWLL